MDIKTIISTAITNIEREKAVAVQQTTQRVIQEKVIPYEKEINDARDKAITELVDKFNSDVAELNSKCEIEKTALINAGEDKKKAFREATIQAEVNAVIYVYDAHIAKLNAQLKELGE